MRSRSITARRHNAFTLVELLVVIAIIAILAAIIFPVFATVRENARQSSSISNMRQISTALGQFQLDNHRNPDVLFGYVYYQYGDTTNPVSMDSAFSKAQADAQAHSSLNVNDTFPGLYPEYVRDVATFRDADNQDNGNVPSKIANGGTTDTNILHSNADGTTTLIKDSTHQFYAEDAYDVSPRISQPASPADPPLHNQIDKTQYVARYQSSWTNIDPTLNNPCTAMPTPATCNGSAATSTNFYTHQLRWKNPPAETYVTSTTYHVPNTDTVLVLFEGGNAKKLNVDQFQQYGADPSTVAVTPGGSTSPAGFWKLIPAGR